MAAKLVITIDDNLNLDVHTEGVIEQITLLGILKLIEFQALMGPLKTKEDENERPS